MTAIERFIARIGITGVLGLLLAASVVANLWQFNRAGKADTRCDAKIGGMVADVDRKTAANEVTALEIGRETTDRAEAEVATITKETVRYVDRIREVRVEVPAACDAPMPDGVRDALADAARAADRRL